MDSGKSTMLSTVFDDDYELAKSQWGFSKSIIKEIFAIRNASHNNRNTSAFTIFFFEHYHLWTLQGFAHFSGLTCWMQSTESRRFRRLCGYSMWFGCHVLACQFLCEAGCQCLACQDSLLFNAVFTSFDHCARSVPSCPLNTIVLAQLFLETLRGFLLLKKKTSRKKVECGTSTRENDSMYF